MSEERTWWDELWLIGLCVVLLIAFGGIGVACCMGNARHNSTIKQDLIVRSQQQLLSDLEYLSRIISSRGGSS